MHGTVILRVANYKAGKLMPIVDIKNEVIISHVAIIQLRYLEVLCHNKAAQHQHLDTVRKHTCQPEQISNAVSVNPIQKHNSTVSPFQDHTAMTFPIPRPSTDKKNSALYLTIAHPDEITLKKRDLTQPQKKLLNGTSKIVRSLPEIKQLYQVNLYPLWH